MKRKNWLSALLALMMVISMVACIALPVTAEGTTPGTLTQEEIEALKPAGEAVMDETDEDGNPINAYKISSVVELVAASANYAAFTLDDTIYLANDLYISETYLDGETEKNFAENYTGFGTAKPLLNFDGNGKTIYNFVDTHSFFACRYRGSIRNVTFDGAKPVVTEGTIIIGKQIEVGVELENVHIINSYLKSSASSYIAAMVPLANGTSKKNVNLLNCSVVDTILESTSDDAVSYMGVFIGRFGGIELTLENCVTVGCRLIAKTGVSTVGTAFVVGHIDHSSAIKTIRLDNVGVFNCSYEFITPGLNAIVATTYRSTATENSFNNIYSAGNKAIFGSTDGEGNLVTDEDGNVVTEEAYMDTLVSHRSASSYENFEFTNYSTDVNVLYSETDVENKYAKDDFNWVDGLLAMDTLVAYKCLPLASTATADDEYSAYQINSVEELVDASHTVNTVCSESKTNSIYSGETIYFTSDLDINEWDCSEWATWDEEKQVYKTKGSYDETAANYVYSEETSVDCETVKDVFSAVYNGWAAGKNAGKFYTTFAGNFDGLGHTISGFYDTHAFFAVELKGTLKNLNFVDAYVDVEKRGGGNYFAAAIVVNYASESTTALIIDNVHVVNSHIFNAYSEALGTSAILSTPKGSGRYLEMYNCSVSGTVIEIDESISTDSCGFLVGRLFNSGTNTIENCVVTECELIVPKNEGEGVAFAIGSINAGNSKNITINNITVTDCVYRNTTDSLSSIVATLYSCKSATVKIDNIFASGNVRTTNLVAKSEVTDGTAMPALFVDAQDLVGKVDTEAGTDSLSLGNENIKTDNTVTYLFDVVSETVTNGRTDVKIGTIGTKVDQLDALTEMNSGDALSENAEYLDWYMSDETADAYPITVKVRNQDTKVNYETVADALADAASGETVLVCTNLTEDEIVVNTGVTLDLNGDHLTADTIVAFGEVEDSTNGDGGLAITGSAESALKSDNAQLPLYDAEKGCYRFFDFEYDVVSASKKTVDGVADAIKFGYRLNFTGDGADEAYTLLSNAENDSRMNFVVNLTWTQTVTVDKDGTPTEELKTFNVDYTFAASTVAQYAGYKLDATKTPAFVLTVSGLSVLDSGTEIITTPRVTTTLGVEDTGDLNSYTYTTAA